MEKRMPKPDPTLLEQYQREMMNMYRRQTSDDENWLDSRFPEPSPIQYRTTAAEVEETADTAEEMTPPEPPIAETPFVGYLRVFVTTADGAQPIADAYVTVTRDDVVYANTVTDGDGYTQVIPLPSVDPALTLTPGIPTPFVTYDIRVNADGFRTVQYDRVPVYGNNYVTQPVLLHPLLFSDDPNAVQDFESGGPVNL